MEGVLGGGCGRSVRREGVEGLLGGRVGKEC